MPDRDDPPGSPYPQRLLSPPGERLLNPSALSPNSLTDHPAEDYSDSLPADDPAGYRRTEPADLLHGREPKAPPRSVPPSNRELTAAEQRLLDRSFGAHPEPALLTPGYLDRIHSQLDRMAALRLAVRAAARTVLELCPDSAERTLAVRALETTRMWAIASIEREGL